MTALPRPVIDGEDARRSGWLCFGGGPHHHAAQRVGAHRHGQALGEAGSGTAAEREPETALHLAEPFGASGRQGSDAGEALGEGLACARGHEAAEPPCLDLERDGASVTGQIEQPALVVAVEAAGRGTAVRAEGGLGERAGHDGDAVGRRQDLDDGEAGRDQGQEMLRHGT